MRLFVKDRLDSGGRLDMSYIYTYEIYGIYVNMNRRNPPYEVTKTPLAAGPL